MKPPKSDESEMAELRSQWMLVQVAIRGVQNRLKRLLAARDALRSTLAAKGFTSLPNIDAVERRTRKWPRGIIETLRSR